MRTQVVGTTDLDSWGVARSNSADMSVIYSNLKLAFNSKTKATTSKMKVQFPAAAIFLGTTAAASSEAKNYLRQTNKDASEVPNIKPLRRTNEQQPGAPTDFLRTCDTASMTMSTKEYTEYTIVTLTDMTSNQYVWYDDSSNANTEYYYDPTCIDQSHCYLFQISDDFGDEGYGLSFDFRYNGVSVIKRIVFDANRSETSTGSSGNVQGTLNTDSDNGIYGYAWLGGGCQW
jgi:hypothetical protein